MISSAAARNVSTVPIPGLAPEIDSKIVELLNTARQSIESRRLQFREARLRLLAACLRDIIAKHFHHCTQTMDARAIAESPTINALVCIRVALSQLAAPQKLVPTCAASCPIQQIESRLEELKLANEINSPNLVPEDLLKKIDDFLQLAREARPTQSSIPASANAAPTQ